MITRFEVSNYRSCLNCSFDLQPHLSVLIGPNASGKTNILNALLLLRKLAEEKVHYRYEEDEPTGKSKIKVCFNIGTKRAIFTATVGSYTDENNRDVVVTTHEKWYMKDFTGKAKHLNIPLSLARHLDSQKMSPRELMFYTHRAYRRRQRTEIEIPVSAIKALAKIGQFLSEMRYYSASQFTNPGKCPISLEIEKEGKKRRGLRLYGHSNFLFDLYTEFKAKSHGYQQFFDIVGPNGIGLVDGITFEEMVASSMDYSVMSGGRVRARKRDKILVIPQFAIGKNKISPNQLSEGTFKTITLLFYLVTEASSILLIEEPEVCVHHGLLSSIVELIKAYSLNKQIVLSTHSDFVLDQVSPENVYKVSCTLKEGTKVKHIPRAMSRRELKALKEYLKTEGNLGEYWKHGALEW